jgi:hypothetical protein
MADRPAGAGDRVAQGQATAGLTAARAGLNLSSPYFNVTYRDMIKLQLGRLTGQELKPDLLDAVEIRLNKNGYKIEDVACDPENYQAAISQALSQAKDGIALSAS